MPEPVTRERAEAAALHFHQLRTLHWMLRDDRTTPEQRADVVKATRERNRHEVALVEFLSDCCVQLPTQQQLEDIHKEIRRDAYGMKR